MNIKERIKEIEEILVDIVNDRSVNPELQTKLEERTGKKEKLVTERLKMKNKILIFLIIVLALFLLSS